MGLAQQGKDGTGLSPHIQSVRPHHRAMARALVTGGLMPGQLAEAFGFSPSQISCILGSPVFQAEVARLEQDHELVNLDTRMELQAMQQKALENIDEELERAPVTLDDRKLRFNASLEVLGMTGLRKTGGSGVQVNVGVSVGEGKPVKDLSEDELRDEVLELSQGPSGTFR